MPSINSFVLSLTVALVVLGGIVPTVAVSTVEASDVDDTGLLEFELLDERYANVDNGELEVRLDRLATESITGIDEIFAISAEDDVERIWIENDVDGLTFYANGDRDEEIGESNPLSLDANDSVKIGASVDTRAVDEGSKTFTIVAEYDRDEMDDTESDGDRDVDPTLEPTAVTLSDTELEAGDVLSVTATFENPGDRTAAVPVELTVDGVVVDRTTVVVGPGETETVEFERSMDLAGTYEVGIGDHTETVTVAEPTDGANVTVSDATLESETIRPGDPVVATATFENRGDEAGDVTAELAVGGVVLETQALSLEPGEEREITFERPLAEEGTYEVAISGTEAGEVTVSQPLLSAGSRELTSSTAVAVTPPAMLGLLFVGGVVRRRWGE